MKEKAMTKLVRQCQNLAHDRHVINEYINPRLFGSWIEH